MLEWTRVGLDRPTHKTHLSMRAAFHLHPRDREMPSTLFDQLSREAKENVLRNLSAQPDAPLWQHEVGLNDALQCMHSAHPLGEAARKMFTEANPLEGESDDDEDFCDGVRFFFKWITLAGQSLTHLRIPFEFTEDVSNKIGRSLKENCTSLRSLDIEKVTDESLAEGILHATRGRLRKLSALSRHAPSIERHCLGLEGLDVCYASDGDGSFSFLKTVGPSLKAFAWLGKHMYSNVSKSKRMLSMMKDFCPRLANISVDVDPEDITAFAELLYSYGEQLLSLDTRQIPKEMYGKLKSACPNMKCSNVVEFEPGIGELGSAVEKLRMNVDRNVDIDMLALQLKPCSELQKLQLIAVRNPAADALRELMRHKKPLLNYVQIYMGGKSFGDDGVLELAKHARSIRSFSFLGNVKNASVFKRIADNAPLLEKVYISHSIVQNSEMRNQWIFQVAPYFENCANLRDLHISIDECQSADWDSVRCLVRRLRLKAALRKNRLRLNITTPTVMQPPELNFPES